MLIIGTKDSGPAHYLAKVASAINLSISCFGSSVSIPVFDNHDVSCSFVDECKLKNAKIILTGTCLGSGLDKDLLLFGYQHGIKTISIIEHWTWMRERFVLDVDEVFLFPDLVLVNDQLALKNAVAAGIPRSIVAVVGNPVLEEKPVVSTSKCDSLFGLAKGKSVLFISEELISSFPEDSKQYLGFSEFDVLSDVVSVLAPDDHLIVKLHPEEAREKYDDLFGQVSCQVSVFQRVNNLQNLFLTVDQVIGMGSMLLLEISRSRGDVLTYRPNESQLFVGNEIGATHLVGDIGELRAILQGEIQIQNQMIGSRFEGSLERIVEFIEFQYAAQVNI